MLDRITNANDKKLASHILNLYSLRKDNEMEIEDESNKISRSLMSKYISYARGYIHPKIPEDLIDIIVNHYVSMRRLGTSKKTITATPRQLESIIRLCEALAKMRFASVASKRYLGG